MYIKGSTVFFNNSGPYSGGALSSTVSLCNLTGRINFNNNNARDGGAIYASNSLIILDGKISFCLPTHICKPTFSHTL